MSWLLNSYYKQERQHLIGSSTCLPTVTKQSWPPTSSTASCHPAIGAQFVGHWYNSPIVVNLFISPARWSAASLRACVTVNTLFLLALVLNSRQRGLETWLLIVLAFFFREWQSFCSTFCDMKMNTGLKHIFDSSPSILVSQHLCLSRWVCLATVQFWQPANIEQFQSKLFLLLKKITGNNFTEITQRIIS